VDRTKVTPGQMIAAGGGALLIISLFLNWDDAASTSAFGTFSGMDIIMLLVGVAAILFAGASAMGTDLTLPVAPANALFLLGVGTVGWTFGWVLEDPAAGLGAWLGLIAALVITYGARQSAAETRVVSRPRTTSPSPSSPPPAV
jgi:hypothetical protein